MATKKIKIKWIRSANSRSGRQKATVKGLGLTRLNQVRELLDTPAIRGMINKIPHLVQVVG